MSVTKHRIESFNVRRVDETHVSLEIYFPTALPGYAFNELIMTDTEFDVLMEAVVRFVESEPERVVHFAESA